MWATQQSAKLQEVAKLYVSKWTKIGGEFVVNQSPNARGYFSPYKSTQGIRTNNKRLQRQAKALNCQMRHINHFSIVLNKLNDPGVTTLPHLTPPNARRKVWTCKNNTLIKQTAHNDAFLNFLVQGRGQGKVCHWQSGAVTPDILGKPNPRPRSGLWAERNLAPYVLFWNPDLQTYAYFGKQSLFKIGYGGKDSFPKLLHITCLLPWKTKQRDLWQ